LSLGLVAGSRDEFFKFKKTFKKTYTAEEEDYR